MKRLIKLTIKPLLILSGLGLAALGVLKAPEFHSQWIRNKVGSQVVMLTDKIGRGGGTGFAMQMPSGDVLTISNSHVCDIEEILGSQLYAHVGRKKYPMTILEKSMNADLCILNGLPNMKGLKLASGVAIGEEIGVVGHPALMPLSLSRGSLLGYDKVIVALHRGPCKEDVGMYKTEDAGFFGEICTEQFEAGLTTVVVLGGNSGSPVINFWGNVVGVLFASSGPSGANYGIIVKLEDLREFIKGY
jgi:S1-C subfamily serine protease